MLRLAEMPPHPDCCAIRPLPVRTGRGEKLGAPHTRRRTRAGGDPYSLSHRLEGDDGATLSITTLFGGYGSPPARGRPLKTSWCSRSPDGAKRNPGSLCRQYDEVYSDRGCVRTRSRRALMPSRIALRSIRATLACDFIVFFRTLGYAQNRCSTIRNASR